MKKEIKLTKDIKLHEPKSKGRMVLIDQQEMKENLGEELFLFRLGGGGMGGFK